MTTCAKTLWVLQSSPLQQVLFWNYFLLAKTPPWFSGTWKDILLREVDLRFSEASRGYKALSTVESKTKKEITPV